MTIIGDTARQNRVGNFFTTKERPAGSIRFDAIIVVLTYWFVIGFYVDGGAHVRGLVDDTFFTPWHTILYSGALAVGLTLGITQLRNMLKGYPLLCALPYGYLPALIGIGIFAIGGVFDFAWHSLFGFEEGMETLLSPAHLLLASGSFLFISAPLRAAWGRQDNATWRTHLPAILSLAAIFSQLTFFTQYANYASRPLTLVDSSPSDDTYFFSLYGVMSVLIPSILGMSVILVMLRRWNLPFGALTLMWTINTLLMIWLRLPFVSEVLPALMMIPLGGMLADILLWRLKPSTDWPIALRWFAFAVPFVTSLAYLLVLNTFGGGLWWQIHMWLGAPFIAGIAGFFLSFLAVPPALPKVTE